MACMDFKYEKIKKLDLKKWLLGGNIKIYALILIVFLAAVIFVFTTVKSFYEPASGEPTPPDPMTSSEESSAYVERNQLYRLRINKTGNFATVYKMDQNMQFTEVYKVLRCSVHPDVKTGETVLTEKFIWRRLTENVYGHYTSRLENGAYIHSVPYTAQDISKLIISAYNRLGEPAEMGSIYMAAADAKWIYENCGIQAVVEIYEDASEDPAMALAPLETLPAGTRFDPSDQTASDQNVHTKIDYMTGVKDCSTGLNEPFDQWKGVYAVDVNGNDITSYIRITGKVDITKEGTYTLIYHLSDNYGTNLAYYRYVTVISK